MLEKTPLKSNETNRNACILNELPSALFWVLANHDKPEIHSTLGRIQALGNCEILDDIIFIPPKNIKSAV